MASAKTAGHFSTVFALAMACAATLHDWGICNDPFCACGSKQTMLHIVNECPLTKFPGGVHVLHSAGNDLVTWLRKLSIC